jgi:hypothetical protein
MAQYHDKTNISRYIINKTPVLHLSTTCTGKKNILKVLQIFSIPALLMSCMLIFMAFAHLVGYLHFVCEGRVNSRVLLGNIRLFLYKFVSL